ncbi:ferric-chelate reductase 1 isoform X1 [Pleurodeles waltl]|uniref:ferric-chelate reductase 1 isoform X1 n=1 Tax=Pleurodeles waltl TaxID=8319 RepID=UPI0037097371
MKMMLQQSAVILAVFSIFLDPVAGYANGKVTRACSSMRPQHGHQAQDSPLHNVTVDSHIFKPGDRVKVTLSGSRFEGFFLQSRDPENLDGDAIGSFTLIDTEKSQLLTCGNVQDSAVSHTSKSRKTQIEVYWNAPSNAPQHIQFLFSVVEKYKIYWVKLPGPIISQTSAPPVTKLPKTTGAPFTSEAQAHLIKPFNSTGCGVSKFCVTNPSLCDPETDSHCFFLSFKAEDDSVLIEMSGPSEGYIAFALSHDQWMGGDDAYLCVVEDQHIQINPAYLSGRAYPEMDSEPVLRDMAWRLADGVIQCSFRRNIHLPTYKSRFDLDHPYYIFVADGEARNGLISRHHLQPLITSNKYVVVGFPENVGGSRSPLLIKAHGALMFVAWMTLVSIGVLVARFFKPVWPDGTIFGEKIWFQVHRILMVSTVLLTCTAFVLPFLYRGGWSKRAGYHPYIGSIVMALALIQLIMAVFRPPPDSLRRPLFNWAHWSTGTTARILAVVAMFLGMDVQALNLPDPWDTYMLTGFILWHVSVDVLLEIHSYCLINKAEVFDDDLVEILNPLSSVGTKGHSFKKVVLTVYICGNLAFLITFLAAIYQI